MIRPDWPTAVQNRCLVLQVISEPVSVIPRQDSPSTGLPLHCVTPVVLMPNRCEIPCCHGCACDLLVHVRNLCAQPTKKQETSHPYTRQCASYITMYNQHIYAHQAVLKARELVRLVLHNTTYLCYDYALCATITMK